MRFQSAKPALVGETRDDLLAAVKSAGFPAFRVTQVLDWVYRKRVGSWDAMTNLPSAFREWLAATYTLLPSRQIMVKQAGDVTEKLLLEQEDRALIETVLIRSPQRGVGQEESRKTVCISTQVGCAYGCKFCASGLLGWRRDLTAGEIVAQLLHVCRLEDERSGRPADGSASFDNLVVMGMGEPLANYDNLIRALTILNAEWGLHFGGRRITVSTSGLVPQIRKLAEEPIGFRLAVSLHGATNETRSRIMPINRRYPIEELLPAIEAFSETHGRMVTLEYILIEEINDTLEEARELTGIARRLHAHVNLIPYNSVEGLPWRRPNLNRQRAFAKVLRDARISVTVRMEKGHDIEAACGQLRLQEEEKRTGSPAAP